MAYKSYKTDVLVAMKLCKHDFCVGVGNLAVSEVKPLVPVDTGNLRRSIVSEVMDDDAGISVGATMQAEYSVYVELGTSKQDAQPFLEPGVVNCIPRIVNVAQKHYDHMGGV